MLAPIAVHKAKAFRPPRWIPQEALSCGRLLKAARLKLDDGGWSDDAFRPSLVYIRDDVAT